MKIDWQVFWTIVGILVAAMFSLQQAGVIDLGRSVNNALPQFINLSGMQLEEQRIGPASQQGRRRTRTVVVTRAPTGGKWRGLLCEGDQIDFINGYEVDLMTARRILYLNRGRQLRIIPDDKDAELITVEPDSFGRDCATAL
jgi:hypothetical protein